MWGQPCAMEGELVSYNPTTLHKHGVLLKLSCSDPGRSPPERSLPSCHLWLHRVLAVD